MLEKIKKTFQNRTSRNGSYSVGLIALVVGIVVAVNLIAAQLPETSFSFARSVASLVFKCKRLTKVSRI